jgi:hypothetical protein
MPSTFLNKFRLGCRAFGLVVVFAGLLFSCGEGIRLIPFPGAEMAQSPASGLQIDEEHDYEKSFLRFENNQTNFQSKSQRGNLQHHWAGASGSFDRPPFTGLPALFQTGGSVNPQIFTSRLNSAFPGSRAPPVS